MSDLTLDEASDLVGDDIGYWLNNPFIDPDAIAAKVCWWITQAIIKTADPQPTPAATEAAASERKS